MQNFIADYGNGNLILYFFAHNVIAFDYGDGNGDGDEDKLPLATCCLQLSWLNEAIMIIISGTINGGTQIGGK